ncbi:uncharacterized protein LOC119990326 [Tripterygium wilfordii]|uniref:uncharacterized protein LOC119990326 n=1 Tax=Tripterygium wilfordii TaxID=458696 RepID=UPI0018F8541A|nr:uncharacterized protein LOC119990326 [Tripterygium wilfordii]
MEETQREIRNPWLVFLVEAPFYQPCEFHEEKNRTYICFDCNGSTFCESCKHKHSTHQRSIRVLKASRETAVTRKDLRQLVGTSDIQKYKINHYTIAYLRQRRQKEGKFQQEKIGKYCAVCRWKLEADSTNEAYIYCSVECKIRDRMRQLEGGATARTQEPISTVMQNNQLMRLLDEGVDSRIQEHGLNGTPKNGLMEQHGEVVDATIEEHASNLNQKNQLKGQPKEGVVEQNNQFLYTGRKRRRKCRPQRSPFF